MADGRKSPQPANPPLPSGWEAKYDFAQKRYFYIDHQNKVTTWENPLLKTHDKQQRHHVGHHGGEIPHVWSTNEEHHLSRGSPKSTPTKIPAKSGTNGGWLSQIEDKYGMKVEMIKDEPEVDDEAFKRIATRFPTVSKDLVLMVKNDCSSEEDLCLKLREMGYKEQKQPTASNTVAFSEPFPRSGSPSHSGKPTDFSGSKTLVPPKSVKTDSLSTSPGHKTDHADLKRASPERTGSAKNVILNNTGDRKSASPGRPLKGKDSGHKGHHQSSSKASPLMEHGTDKKKKSKDKMESHHEKTVAESASNSEEKIGLDAVSKNAAAAAAVAASSISNEMAKLSVASDVDKVSGADSASALLTTESCSSTDTNATNEASGSQRFQSSLRHETKGPDASLAKGPNKQLLLSDYVNDVGSQSSNYYGPSKENYHGPCAELQKGHEPGLDKGSVLIQDTTSSRCTITTVISQN